jgi:DNA sulfur modification protein DndE
MDFAELKAQAEAGLALSRGEEGYSLGLQAFKYGYPAIEMYRSRWEWHYDVGNPSYNGPVNQLGHTKRAIHEDRFVVTPIIDAVYSRAFLDLDAEPMVIEAPQIEDNYWTIQICDFYTNSFAYIGKSQGDGAGSYAIVGPNWRGVLPEGLNRSVVSPTPVACVLARVAVLNDDEAQAVALQHQFRVSPLSVWTGEASEPPEVVAPRPYLDFKSGDPLDFFRMLNWVLTENPAPPEDAGVLGLFERIGVVPGTEFDPTLLHPATVDGMKRGIEQGLVSLLGEMPFCVPNVNGWLIPNPSRSGNFGTDYHLRLVTAEIGLLANDAREPCTSVASWTNTVSRSSGAANTASTTTRISSRRWPSSGRSPCTPTRRGSSPKAASTATRSAVSRRHCNGTTTARSTSTSSGSRPARTGNRTGCRPLPRVSCSGSSSACTTPDPTSSTAPGNLNPSNV